MMPPPSLTAMHAPLRPASPEHDARQNEPPFLRFEIRRSLQMHWRLSALIVTVSLLASLTYVALRWPVYIAQTVVYIQPSAPQLLGKENSASWPNDANAYDTFIQQKVQSASNPSVLIGALRRLPANSWQRVNESEQSAALRLGRAIEAKRMGTSYQLSITAKAHDGEQAAQIANAVAAAVIDNAAREASAGNNERINALEAERDRIQKSLDLDRTEQDAINAKLGIASVGVATPNHYDADIAQLHEALIKARANREEAAARLNAMNDAGLNAEADEQLNNDLGLVGLKTSLNQRRATLIAQMANLTPNHPLYKQDADELAHIDATLDATLKAMRAKVTTRIQQKLRTDLTHSTALEEGLNAQLIRMAGTAAGATPEMQRAGDLALEIARLQARFGAIDEQRNNLKLLSSTAGAATLASAAVAPPKPNAMAVLHVAVPVAIFGIIMALFAALLAQNLDPHIYTTADVERLLNCAPMGQLPDFAQVSSSVAEEHLLRLAASLEHAWQQGAVKNCILTACMPGAGTTTIAAHIRDLLEELGHPALLVRASSAQPLSPEDDQETSRGRIAPRQIQHSLTMLQKLCTDAAPDQTDAPTSRLVLTDTAPLLISAETEHLARYADATILIVESGVTTGEQLRKAIDLLQQRRASAVGIVLNRIHLQHADSLFLQSIRMLEKKFVSFHDSVAQPAAAWPPAMPEVPSLADMAAESSLPASPATRLKPPAPSDFSSVTRPDRDTDFVVDSPLRGLRKIAFEQRLNALRHPADNSPMESRPATMASATAVPPTSAPLEVIADKTAPELFSPSDASASSTPTMVWSWKTNSYHTPDDVQILPSLPGQYGRRKS